MANKFEQLVKEARKLILQEKEKFAMRENLVLFIKTRPIGAADAKKQYQQKPKIILSSFSYLNSLSAIRAVSIALVFVLFAGGGIAFGANYALPGDILYPVKVGINEKIQIMAAFSSESKAKAEISFAALRLEEAEKLAKENKLDAATSDELNARFSVHANSAKDNIRDLKKDNDFQTAAEIDSDFETALATHRNILTSMSASSSGSGLENSEIASIIGSVGVELQAIVGNRVESEAKLSLDSKENIQNASEQKIQAAEAKIKELEEIIERNKVFLRAESYAQLQIVVEAAKNILVQSRAKFDAKEYDSSFRLSQKSIRLVEQLRLLIKAKRELKVNLRKVNIHINGDAGVDGSGESTSSPVLPSPFPSPKPSESVQPGASPGNGEGGDQVQVQSQTQINGGSEASSGEVESGQEIRLENGIEISL